MSKENGKSSSNDHENDDKKKQNEINGTKGNDIILGTVDADLINGLKGDDAINAGDGDDFVHGNNGNDLIEGGSGNDKIYGNAGIDTAVFNGSILDYSWAISKDDEDSDDDDDKGWFEGKVIITDLNAADGDTGVDTLKHIEKLHFNDFTFNVIGNNAPLLISADSQATDENTVLTFTSSAYDFDGDSVTATVVAASGAVIGIGSSPLTTSMGSGTEFTIDYNPGSLFQHLAVGETANDTVQIEVSDGNGGISGKFIDIIIAGVNDAPTGAATVSLADGTEDTAYTVSASDLLAGFSDLDTSDTLSVAGLAASNGTVANNGDGTFTITPTANFNGVVTLNYDVIDGHDGGIIAATQSYTLAAVNDAPVANDDANALTVTSLASITQTNIVKWVDWTNSTGTGGGTPGTVTGTINLGNGQIIDVTYTGEFQFTQTNGGINYYTGSADTYTSSAVANGPTEPDIIALSQATQKTLTFSQPVDNLFFAIVSLNGNGYLFDQDFQIASYGQGYWGTGSATKVALPDGRFEVVGNDELHGVLQIAGSVQSLTWTSQTAENWNGFTIGTYGKAQSATVSGNLLANDSDPESDVISVAAVNGQSIAGNSITLDLASGARVKVNKDGTYLYDEDSAFGFLGQNQIAQDSFQYTISDGHGGTATATATIAVTGINDAPVITDGDLVGAITAVTGPATAPSPIAFTVEQYLGYQSNNLTALRDYAASHTANYTVQTNVIDYTDDPNGFAGELPGSSPWPAAVATGDTNTHSTTNNNFFARITADFSVATADTYTFRTYNDDGVFLLIDNIPVITDTRYHGEESFEGNIELTPGEHSIELFFFEDGGEASLEFSAKNSTGTFGLVGASGGGLGGSLLQLTDSGNISFSDADLNDSHIISAITPAAGALGTLTASVSTDTTGSGVGGVVSWNYNVAAAAVEYLVADETKVERFDVTLDDLHGGLITEQIEVTITGASDAPIII